MYYYNPKKSNDAIKNIRVKISEDNIHRKTNVIGYIVKNLWGLIIMYLGKGEVR